MPVLVRCLLRAEAALRRLARRKWLAILVVTALSLVGRALLLPVLPAPKPAIQDEFSYLLAADTFSHGRLANPPHPMRASFETLQVLSQPTYASKYPPLSAMMMAFGQRVFGHPWAGVWLSTGMLCGALCWALQGWLPPYWAFLGALLMLARIGVVSYWTESYWGGSCAAIGGALVVGALPRLIRRRTTGCAVVFGAGLAILANTRPFEGMLLAFVCAVALVIALPFTKLLRFASTIALVLVPVLEWMAYYNFRVTGDPLLLPYRAYEKQYAVWSPFMWQSQPSPEPHYNNDFLRAFWVVGDGAFKQFEREHILKVHVYDFFQLEQFYLGAPIFLCICGCLWVLARNRKGRGALILLGALAALMAVEGRMVAHYAAPATALIFCVAVWSLRVLRRCWPGRRMEALYVTWAMLALFIVETGWHLSTPQGRYFASGPDYHRAAKREKVLAQIANEPGNQLVLVHYGPKHDLFEELVYNPADIDSARVVWARSLDPFQDQALLRYYRGRKVWLVEEDGEIVLAPHPVDQYYTSSGRRSDRQVF